MIFQALKDFEYTNLAGKPARAQAGQMVHIRFRKEELALKEGGFIADVGIVVDAKNINVSTKDVRPEEVERKAAEPEQKPIPNRPKKA